MQYLVRAGISADLANRLWDDGINFATSMRDKLGEYIIEDIKSNLIDYLVFTCEDCDEKTARQHVSAAFAELYPDRECILSSYT